MFGFADEFIPLHNENRMASEGDTASARNRFIDSKLKNLKWLLEARYSWMDDYITGNVIYELGAGAGFSKFFIKSPYLKLTDVTKREWIDITVDALNMPFLDGQVDTLICSHMIHHLAKPPVFFQEVLRVLKPGGRLIIVDINTSWVMRLLLWLMRHEGWSYRVDVFNPNTVTNNPADPWSANCAIPELLFSDENKFKKNFPDFSFERNKLFECFMFPLSGGVIAKSPTISLSDFALNIVSKIDTTLVWLFPKIFAMGRQVVLRKKIE